MKRFYYLPKIHTATTNKLKSIKRINIIDCTLYKVGIINGSMNSRNKQEINKSRKSNAFDFKIFYFNALPCLH